MIKAGNISYKIGRFTLSNIELDVPAGKYMSLLGPAGSGKTLFLECICGIRKVDKGRIIIANQDVTKLPPRQRNVGYVPQDYVLFRHLTVENNIAFSMKVAGRRKADRKLQSERIAELLGISGLLNCKVDVLSGGEKQRVALARALIMQPDVLLMDEPVCALNETKRQEICSLLRLIAYDFNLTVIHVSHNLEEAFSVADTAAIMRNGEIVQTGTLDSLLRNPETEFVAKFMRCENILTCKASGQPYNGITEADIGQASVVVPGVFNGLAKIAIRPENVEVYSPEAAADQDNMFIVSVIGWRDYGNYIRMEMAGPMPLVAHMTYDRFARLNIASSTKVVVRLRPENIRLLTDKVDPEPESVPDADVRVEGSAKEKDPPETIS